MEMAATPDIATMATIPMLPPITGTILTLMLPTDTTTDTTIGEEWPRITITEEHIGEAVPESPMPHELRWSMTANGTTSAAASTQLHISIVPVHSPGLNETVWADFLITKTQRTGAASGRDRDLTAKKRRSREKS